MQAAVDIDDLTSEVPGVLTLTAHDLADVSDDLHAYQTHFAPLFQRREQRAWADVYLRGLLLADVPRKNVEAMALRLLGAGLPAARQSALSSSSSVREPGTMRPSCTRIRTWSRRRWAKTMGC